MTMTLTQKLKMQEDINIKLKTKELQNLELVSNLEDRIDHLLRIIENEQSFKDNYQRAENHIDILMKVLDTLSE